MQRGEDRFGFCRVGDQSSGEQTDGEAATNAVEPARSASTFADPDPGARSRVGEYLPPLVSKVPAHCRSCDQESGMIPRNLPLSKTPEHFRQRSLNGAANELLRSSPPATYRTPRQAYENLRVGGKYSRGILIRSNEVTRTAPMFLPPHRLRFL